MTAMVVRGAMKPPRKGRIMAGRIITGLFRPAIGVPLVATIVAAAELLVANRKFGVFTGGFGQSSAVDTPGEIALFALGFVLAQLAIALLAWKIAARLARASGAQATVLHFAFLYGGISLLVLSLQYQLHSYFSDAVSFALLKQLGGGSATDALLFAKNEIMLGLAALAAFLLAWWVAARLLHRLTGPQPALDATRSGWHTIAAIWLLLVGGLFVIPRIGGDGARGLERIMAWQALGDLLSLASDFDGDGYGLAGRVIDPHPFDEARHPLALDVPGNGIDEDGYGGDLALVPVPGTLPETPLSGKKPHLVIVVLESTRADVLGKQIDGQVVAPNLARVAAQGGAIAPAYSHVGFTTASLKSLFAGSLVVPPGSPSLFRELYRSGYEIGVFSGQPEDFGGISEAVGMREVADHFVDAELLKDQRAFSFAAQGSLLIDENIVLDRFDSLLGDPAIWTTPQFVYFNFQTPHFPYHHDGVPERFARPPLERGQIGAENRDALQRTYWNAVAYSDAALGRLIDRLQTMGVWDETVLVVTGDHGEALFEEGFLGHGHIINDRQNATFFASNRPLAGVSAPISLSDYRRIILRMLGAEVPEGPIFEPFLHIGPLESPTAIGMADRKMGVISLRLDSGAACVTAQGRCRNYASLDGAEREAFDRLVARWGSERWAARRREARPEAASSQRFR